MWSSLILWTNHEKFLGWIVTWEEKWILYDKSAATSSVAGPRWSSKALPKAKQKKGMVTSGLLPIWSTTTFWILAKPLHLRSSANQSTATPVANTGQQKEPDSSPWQHLIRCYSTNASKVEQTGIQSFPSSTIFPWPLANRLPLLRASWWLSRENASITGSEPENAFQEFVKSQTTDFYATGIKLISHSKNVLIAMVPSLINKDVFEPTYNDLKFIIQNHNYICANLIY